MKQYLDLLQCVLANGVMKENRTGVDTISVFNYNYVHDLREGFPLLTTKKISWKNIVIELLWFLTGSNDCEFLDRHNCVFWKPWYNTDGTVNAAYGPAWRKFDYPLIEDSGISIGYNDQIRWVLNKLKSNPMSRDLVVSAWRPHVAQKPPTINAYWAPCHCMFIFNVQMVNPNKGRYSWEVIDCTWDYDRDCIGIVWADNVDEAYERAIVLFKNQSKCIEIRNRTQMNEVSRVKSSKILCLHLTQRSADVCVGVPYNIASYALFNHLMARFSGIEPGIFAHTLVDAHIYTVKPDGSNAEFDHVPGARQQLTRLPRKLPNLIISDKIRDLEDLEKFFHPSVSTDEIMSHFIIENYNPHPHIPFQVAV